MNYNVDFYPSPAYTQIMVRHRIITLLIIILASMSLYADKAFLYTNTEPNAITASGALFSDNTYSAASNDYKINSVVEITDIATGASVVVMINDVLPKTVEGRTIAITKAAAKELGILDKGIADVSIRLIRGEVAINSPEKDTESGWYSYDLGLFENDNEAYKVYSRLIRNNQKPAISVEDGMLRIKVPYVREFERENAEIAIALSGVANPIPSKTASPFN